MNFYLKILVDTKFSYNHFFGKGCTKFRRALKYVQYGNYKQMVKKEIKKDEESKNDLKLEMTLNKYEYNIMTTLTKGSFIGLEISTGINCFKYNYVCKSNFASIFEINFLFI